MTQEQTHSAGVCRAAIRIVNAENFGTDSLCLRYECVEQIINEETHIREMQTFIEKVAEMDFGGATINESAYRAQAEAFALIQKVRG